MKAKRTYRLNVSYNLDLFNDVADARIEKIVGQEPESSGAGFGWRDLSFCFLTKGKLDAARRRLSSAKRLKLKFTLG